MWKLAFTLVELLIVIILMGIVSFLVIKLPSFSSSKSGIDNLYTELYPDGNITVYEGGKIKSTKPVTFMCGSPRVYIYKNGDFEKKEYKTGVIFMYSVKNGTGKSFILGCDDGFYVFKPFGIKKEKNLHAAENYFTGYVYRPEYGSYY